MTAHPRIEIDADVMSGKPVIKGTRITVEHILRMTAAGWSADDLVEQHPRLTKDDIQAANAFAADQIRISFAHFGDAAE
jgi:uncharacterized protein (DUF433 family)